MMSTTNHFDAFFKQLHTANDLDEKLAKMEEFSKIIYENLENISQAEIAQAVKQLYESVKTVKKG